MRSIFFKFLLSFFLTILLSGLISGLVMFANTHRSVESFRNNFLKQLHANVAHSVVLLGQAAYVMQQHQSAQDFEKYLGEINDSMRTRIYLCIDGKIIPQDAYPQSIVENLSAAARMDDAPFIQDTGKELIVVQRLVAPDGNPYMVVGLHQLKPPHDPGGGPLPPHGPGPGFLSPEMGGGPPPHGRHDPGFPPPPEQWGWFRFFRYGPELQTLVLLVVAGIVCFKLARSFSAPLDRLRRTSREIAAGNLSARVGASLGKPGNEIGDLGRDFDNMAERMESLVNAQKRLLLDISHELRSPLTRLNLALELARKRFQAEGDGHLERIAKESERLNDLIGQLLTLTRMEGCKIIKETELVRLDELLSAIAEDIDFETSSIDRGVEILSVEPLSVVGSRELLRQAIENIVRNGAYYTRPGSRVQVSLFSGVRDDAGIRTGAAVIHVRDFGSGVPEEKLPHIMEPFFRVAEARDRNSGGTGIGLAIAHQAVKQHRGCISFANASDQEGLIVTIQLPLPG